MKAMIIIGAAGTLAVMGWWLGSSVAESDEGSPPRAIPAQQASLPPTTIHTNPVDVFQKAFWKRPTDADQILHAERREWEGNGGLQRWSWHLGLRPSDSLVEHLITANAFMLTQSSEVPGADSPGWFPKSAGGFHSFTNTAGTFQLFWDKEKNLMYATDSGGGFRAGASDSVRSVVQKKQPGRLPTTPPPKP